jgi:hypothetical protein
MTDRMMMKAQVWLVLEQMRPPFALVLVVDAGDLHRPSSQEMMRGKYSELGRSFENHVFHSPNNGFDVACHLQTNKGKDGSASKAVVAGQQCRDCWDRSGR